MKYSPDAVLAVIDALNGMNASYILTGSLATNVYCVPRSTLDADFVVDLIPERLEKFFASLGANFVREPQMSFETVTGKAQHKFRYRPTKFLVEIFEARMDDPHERARFDRRRAGPVEGRTAFIPTAEDVIIQKLRWFKQIRRTKDRDDVRNVLNEQWNALDWKYIERWCGEHGTSDLLNEIRNEVRQLRES